MTVRTGPDTDILPIMDLSLQGLWLRQGIQYPHTVPVSLHIAPGPSSRFHGALSAASPGEQLTA